MASTDNETQVPYVLRTVGLTAGLSTVAVLLRTFTRLSILHTFGADDAVMLIAQVLTLGSAVAIFSGEYSIYTSIPHDFRIPVPDLNYHSRMRIRSWTTHRRYASRSLHPLYEIFLLLHHHLQRRHVHRQNVHHAPIPTHLHRHGHATHHPRGSHLRGDLGIHSVDLVADGLQPRVLLLGYEHRQWQMSESVGHLVCHGVGEPGDGFCHVQSAVARHQELAVAQEAKVYAHGGVLSWVLHLCHLYLPRYNTQSSCQLCGSHMG